MNSEIERVKTLLELDILDTNPEQMFDDITELASKLCDMPIALISLLDSKRQFFKSSVGIDIKETPIEESFCKIAIETPEDIFIVEDARVDERFKDFPLVKQSPNIVSYYGVPLQSKNGVPFGTLCVIGKKTVILSDDQKDILMKLSRQVEYLIDLRTKNNLLTDYKAKLERYSNDMEEFAYLAAHDLKAPVRAVDSFIKLLDKKHQDNWDEKDKKYISFINQSSLKMNNLINDLLEYSKCNLYRKNYEIFDVKKLIEDIFNGLNFKTGHTKPILICGDMPKIYSSLIGFTVLFNNLINNGLKYQKEGQKPIIEVKYSEDTLNRIFSITDNGIGIEEEYLEQIFKPFKRLHNSSEYQGTGLGLAACSKIIENLEGKIWLESKLGQGTTFYFTIPK